MKKGTQRHIQGLNKMSTLRFALGHDFQIAAGGQLRVKYGYAGSNSCFGSLECLGGLIEVNWSQVLGGKNEFHNSHDVFEYL